MNKRLFRTLAFLAVMLFCFSCSNILQEAPEENTPQGTARLKLSVDGALNDNARTIFAPNDVTDYTYKLTGKMQGKTKETIYSYENYSEGKSSFTYSELISTEFSIKIGTWEYITLSAYTSSNSSKCIYSATLSDVEIAEGTNELTFEMQENPDYSGSGSFQVTLNLPEDAQVKYADAAIFYLSGAIYQNYRQLSISNHSVVFSSNNIQAGMYILSFRFYKNGKEIKPGYSELLHIKDCLTSTAERTIESFEKLHAINYNLNGGKISGSSIPASFEEQKTVLLPTAQDVSKRGYDFAGWYETEDFSGEAVTKIPSGTRTDVTLFAKWNPISYKITYQEVGGATNSNPQTYTAEDQITLAPLQSTIETMHFIRWLSNGKTITVIQKGTTGDIVLAASWKVTIELNAEEAIASLAQNISEQTGTESFNVIITGTLTSEQLSSIVQIIKNSRKRIELDLSKATGLNIISSNAFENCTNLESIVIPNGVTEIEANAFKGCENLKTITIPGSLVEIGTNAFYNCRAITTVYCASVANWRKIKFGNDYDSNPLNPLKSNRKAYANGRDITDAIYTYTISYLGLNGASNSNPKTYDSRVGLTLENSVKAGVKFDYWTLDGERVTKISTGTKGDKTLTANWKEGFYDTAKNAASGSLKTYLKDQDQNGVGPFNVSITGALTSDYLSAIVAALNAYPKKLVRLDLDETTGLIGLGNLFRGCKSLETIIIPNGVTKIGESAFYECTNLTNITLPGSIEAIYESAFDYCNSLANVYFNGDIADWCAINFQNTYGSIPSSNPLYYAKHFYVNGTEQKNIVIPNGVTTINSCAFRNATCIETITIPGSVQVIYNNSFYGCTGLKSVTINNGVTKIGEYAFYKCTNLTNITLPGSIEAIYESAFDYCNSLANVYFNGDIADWCAINFQNTYGSIPSSNPLYYAKHFYVNGTEQKNIVIPDNAKNINSYAFYNCINIQSVTVGSGVTFIGKYAFYGCTKLTSVTFKDTVGWSCGNVTDAATNAAKLRATGSGNWGSSELRKK